MEQHIIIASGPPAAKPLHISMLYLDYANKKRYISSGVESVNDWGRPLVTEDFLEAVLAQFDPYENGPARLLTKVAPVVEVEGRRFVRLFPNRPVDGGKYIVITDDNNDPETFYLDLMAVESIRDDEEIVVFNATQAPMQIPVTDEYDLLFALSPNVRGKPRGEIRFKLIRNLNGQKKLWVVTGDLEINN